MMDLPEILTAHIMNGESLCFVMEFCDKCKLHQPLQEPAWNRKLNGLP